MSHYKPGKESDVWDEGKEEEEDPDKIYEEGVERRLEEND